MTVINHRLPEPFTAEDYTRRMHSAVDQALQAGLDGLVIAPGPDLGWLTGYRSTAGTERPTLLVLVPALPPTLLVPTLEQADAEAAPGMAGVQIVDWPDGADPHRLATMLLDSDGSIGISDTIWSVHLLEMRKEAPTVRFHPVGERLPMLRAVKDGKELLHLARAGAAADEAYREIVETRFAGRRELDVAADLARLLQEFGHEQVDVTVVGAGADGADPHQDAGDRLIRSGDTVVMDFGGLLAGYGSDMTRTVSVGRPDSRVVHVHDVVRAAQEAAFRAVRPGVRCEEIDRVARRVITEAGYGDAFVNRTGHGIGVTTHEPPYLAEGERQTLQPGMCFSIEPGIHLPGGFGVRIEDVAMVTDTGGARLNNADRDLRVVR
jgi:D-alanyl-D-alanine dipeptidase